MLALTYYPFDLGLSEAFTVSSNSRTHTEAIFVVMLYDGISSGYGQASFPPYMKEKRDDNINFLSKVGRESIEIPWDINTVHKYLDDISSFNTPAKAAVDIALHDLDAKIKGVSVCELLGLDKSKKIFTSYTIGIGDKEFITRQVKNAKDFKTLKVKLGGDIAYNKNAIELIRKSSEQPIGVDFNQGIGDKETAIEMVEWLANKNVFMVEQPLPVSIEEEYIWLKDRSPIDIYGDESIQNLSDLMEKKDLFQGVNIKLMKCGGISKAYELANTAKSLKLKTMIGCMTESVCATTAAAHLASMFDVADLDGNLLITNDLFTGITINKGEVILPEGNGLGLTML